MRTSTSLIRSNEPSRASKINQISSQRQMSTTLRNELYRAEVVLLDPHGGKGPLITVFGSARTEETHPEFIEEVNLTKFLAGSTFKILTGAGPGIMAAASKGAFDAHGNTDYSLGIRIHLDFEAEANPHCKYSTLRHFFVRKLMLTKKADGIRVSVGGLGSLDETFEVMSLMANRDMKPTPMVISRFWKPLLDATSELLTKAGQRRHYDKMMNNCIVSNDPETIKKFFDLKLFKQTPRVQLSSGIDYKMIENIISDVFHVEIENPQPRTHLAIHGVGRYQDLNTDLKDFAKNFHKELRQHFSATDLPLLTVGASSLNQALNQCASEAREQTLGLCPPNRKGNGASKTYSFNYHMGAEVGATKLGKAHIFTEHTDIRALAELFELWTLVQTRKIEPVPIILIGPAWKPFLAEVRNTFLDSRDRKHGSYPLISPSDMDIVKQFDEIAPAMQHLAQELKPKALRLTSTT